MPPKLARVFLLTMMIALAACQTAPATPSAVPPTKLRFTYWGSDMEKSAVEQMVAAFEESNPDIRVEPIHLTYEEYLARITSMIGQGEGPDVGYFPGLQAPLWAQEGKLLDLTNLVQTDPMLSSALPSTRYYYGNGRIAGLNTAVEVAVLFYNKTLFDQAGLAYPPADPAKAWTWEQFVAAAQKLTVDANGRHAGEDGFDPKQIRTYGAAFDKIYEGWTFYPFVFSNGGQVINDDGTRLLLDSPEAVQAIQNLADLMWVHHVTPTPEQDTNLPGYVAMLQTGNLAMHISGQWSLLDYASVKDLKFGVAVLPSLKKPVTVVLGSPTVIFAGTRNKDAALRFYKFHNNPEAVQLFARGLWMPLQGIYYTDPAKMRFWLDNPAHPAELRPVFTDYVMNNTTPLPSYYVRNYAEVLDKAVRPAMESIWNNEATAAEALRQAVAAAQPLMQGRWDR
jgi:multiple sugar transport system substrate-binding protein